MMQAHCLRETSSAATDSGEAMSALLGVDVRMGENSVAGFDDELRTWSNHVRYLLRIYHVIVNIQ